MMFDTTADVSHNEQMSHVLRFVDVDNETKTAVIKEVFIDFIVLRKNYFKIDKRSDVSCLLHNMYTFSFLTMLPFWDDILNSIDGVQKKLQSPKINFNEARADIQNWNNTLRVCGILCVKNAIVKGEEKCAEWDIDVDQQRRVHRKKKMAVEETQDEPPNVREEMDGTLKVILDRLKTKMRDRFTRLSHLDEQLGFLLETEILIDSKEDMTEGCKVAAAAYEDDFDGEELDREIADCRMLMQKRKDSAFIIPKTPIELFKFAISYGDDVFPNLQVALRILLSVAVSVASCEHSFSKLKLINNFPRSTMGQGRLSNLALLSIKKEEFQLIDIDSVIDKFLNAKPGRMSRLYELEKRK